MKLLTIFNAITVKWSERDKKTKKLSQCFLQLNEIQLFPFILPKFKYANCAFNHHSRTKKGEQRPQLYTLQLHHSCSYCANVLIIPCATFVDQKLQTIHQHTNEVSGPHATLHRLVSRPCTYGRYAHAKFLSGRFCI